MTINENQKPVTEDYRKRWDEIFGSRPKKQNPAPFAGDLGDDDIEENDDEL